MSNNVINYEEYTLSLMFLGNNRTERQNKQFKKLVEWSANQKRLDDEEGKWEL